MFEYKTQVKIDFKGLPATIAELKAYYDEIGNRDSHEGRSRFTIWNNINTFFNRWNTQPTQAAGNIIETEGRAKGNSARVYYQPSVTSYAKPFRKHIVPTNPDNVFVFFDLKAAEFIMNCVFCGETEAVEAYQRGEDVYMHYSYIFPEGTPRKTIKTILIAQMYGTTAYRVSTQLGVSEAVAQRMLDMVARALPKMTMQKRRVISYAMKTNAYWAPRGFNQQDLVKIAEVNPQTGFSPDFALSAYVQSALGFFMQDFIAKLLPKTTGTLLTVFDSVLCEMKPDSMQRYVDWVSTHISPFRADGFHFGKTFWEAAYGDQEVK